MELKQIQWVYFLGIGGIGMSALAQYFNYLGKKVSGYDQTETKITKNLMAKGISVSYQDTPEAISIGETDAQNGLIVYTPAIPTTNKLWQHFKQKKIEFLKRAVVLGMLTKPLYTLAVAGTHGKTTTSIILAHIFKTAKKEFIAFMGGVSEDFNNNFYMGGNEYAIVEADEFDKSFLHLSPKVACITTMDSDHLDTYKNTEKMTDAFQEFATKIKDKSHLLITKGLPIVGTTFGIEENADYDAYHIRQEKQTYLYDLKTPNEIITNIRFSKPGRHNLLNSIAAITMALTAGISVKYIKKALASFQGIQRRFSYQIDTDRLVYIDDYAHHPTEIKAMCDAVRELYPNKKLVAIFQPHLFSRTKDFVEDFARELSQFDAVGLLEIYPARELPIKGVNAQWLCNKITLEKKEVIEKKAICDFVKKQQAEVVLTLGAGDIGRIVSKLKKQFLEKV